MVRAPIAALPLIALLSAGAARAAEPALPASKPKAAAPAKPRPAGADPAAERAVVETIPLPGFDPEGEPEVQRFSDGSLRLLFEFMPPSFTDGRDASLFDHLERHLSKALGVEVFQEDRETFHVPKPREDTLARLRKALAELRARFP